MPSTENSEKNQFICPHCGSDKSDIAICVSREYNEDDVWSAILQFISCSECQYNIPTHLAERWNGLSVEEAKTQWREIYLKTAWQELDD